MTAPFLSNKLALLTTEKSQNQRIRQGGLLENRQVADTVDRMEFCGRNSASDTCRQYEGDGLVFLSPQQQHRDRFACDTLIQGVEHHAFALDSMGQQCAAESPVTHLNPISVRPVRELAGIDEVRRLPFI